MSNGVQQMTSNAASEGTVQGANAGSTSPAMVSRFRPFYEGSEQGRLTVIGKTVVAVAAGSGFMILRFAAEPASAFSDWSILLAVLISTAIGALYFATHTFNLLLSDVGSRAGDVALLDLIARARRALSDTKLLAAGGGFAILNTSVALALGVPNTATLVQATLIVGYAVAGFVCGMAAYCIVGVYSVLRHLPQHLHSGEVFDYTAPDGCGGTSFVGEALIVFGGVTLVVGVLISLYIINAPWQSSGSSRDPWIDLLVGFWLLFPYLMSLAALILPALPIKAALREYKTASDIHIRRELRSINEGRPTITEEALRREEGLRARRLELHRMRLWPFDVKSYVTYATVLGPNALATFRGATSWFTSGNT